MMNIQNKEDMIEIRVRNLVGLIAICLLFGLSFICFTQHKHISNLRQAIEQRDSLIHKLIYSQKIKKELI